ncbi:hypothetical protein [Oceanobacillus caeni]|uniref:hypothetical protein n=1 Tax=Oceanobacillus caeni TaxID=405946 RepID=UPI0036335026
MQKSLTDILNSAHVFNLFGISKERNEFVNKMNHEFELVAQIIFENIDGYTYINADLTVDIEKVAKVLFGNIRGKNCGQVYRMLEGYQRNLFRYFPKEYMNERESDLLSIFYCGFGIAKKVDYLHHISGFPFVRMKLDENFRDALLLDKITAFFGLQVVNGTKYSERLLCELFKKRLIHMGYQESPNRLVNIKWSEISLNQNQIEIPFDEGKKYLTYIKEKCKIVEEFTTNDEEETIAIVFTEMDQLERTHFKVDKRREDKFLLKVKGEDAFYQINRCFDDMYYKLTKEYDDSFK